MAGALIEAKISDGGIQRQLADIQSRLGNLRPAWALIGQIVLESVQRNFRERRAPDGTPWKPVSAAYARAKAKKGHSPDNILVLRNRLLRSINAKPGSDHVEVGTNVVYAAIHQFGGSINKKASARTVYFKIGKGKSRFSKKAKANFAQDVNIGAHTINMPARTFLGIRAEDWGRMARGLEQYLLRGK
ncbi:MAG: phage virion morphogenesis protein [Syntrophobacteraceae bacterium]